VGKEGAIGVRVRFNLFRSGQHQSLPLVSIERLSNTST
jgi:hypothetical protein